MSPIPKAMRKQMSEDPYYRKCARASIVCDGRITWEHVFCYAGRQIQEIWAIIPLCVYHHLDAGMKKPINELISLRRATPQDLAKYPNTKWDLIRKNREREFGTIGVR